MNETTYPNTYLGNGIYTRMNVSVEQINKQHSVVKIDGKTIDHYTGVGAFTFAMKDVNERIDRAIEAWMNK